MRNHPWRVWFLGIIAAIISGGAGALTVGTTASAIAPQAFNFGAQLHSTLLLMLFTFIQGAIVGVAAYLKGSPLPREVWTEEQKVAQKNGG